MEKSAAVRLTATKGPHSGKVFAFDRHDIFIFGRAGDCHCSIPDDGYLSSHHFLLEINPPDCELRDLGSKNGTFVNGIAAGQRAKGQAAQEAARQARPVRLRDGDVIRAGLTEFAVAVSEPGAEAKSPSAAAPKKKDAGAFTRFMDGIVPVAPKEPAPTIPGYVIEKTLQEGGMGRVFRARKEDGGPGAEPVVLKVVKAALRRPSPELTQMFQRELNVAKELNHPNIVRVLDQGEAEGALFFVMEFCEQGSVGELMGRSGGRLSPARAGEIALEALAGLEYAHLRNIVHRDLKPGNLLIAGPGKGSVKIADFGLAKNFALAGMSGMTASGDEGSGTPQFMPKEQLTDFRSTKPVSDVFGLGATLYNMLTGKFVYDFSASADPCVAILHDRVVPVGQRGVSLPAPLSEVVDKATAPDFRDRYQSAREFSRALLGALNAAA